MQRLIRWGGVVVLALAISGIRYGADAQEQQSVVGVTARVGVGVSDEIDSPIGVGFEAELWPTGTLVPNVRFDDWEYGINCPAFPGPCPSGVTTLTVGMKYRAPSAGRVALYVGTDVGRMHWTSGTSGLAVRLRAGTDIRVVRHVILNIDGGVARFVELSSTGDGQLHNHLVAFSAGLKLWT